MDSSWAVPLYQFASSLLVEQRPLLLKYTDHLNSSTMVSYHSSVLFELRTNRPLMSIVLESAKAQLKQYHDHGFQVVLMSTGLYIMGCELMEKYHLSREMMNWMLGCVLKEFNEFINGIRIRINIFEDIEVTLSFLSQFMHGKNRYTTQERMYLSSVCLKGFASSLKETNDGTVEKPNIQLLEVPGFSIQESKYLNALIIPVTCMHLKELMNVNILLFDIPLTFETLFQGEDEFERKDSRMKVEISNADKENSVISRIQEWISKLLYFNVKVVFSQKIIHRHIKFELLKNGIIPFERLNQFNINSVRLCAQCPVLRHLEFQKDDIGFLNTLKSYRKGKTEYTWLESRRSEVRTLMICAETKRKTLEVKEICSRALDVLFALLFDPYLCPGQGKTEFAFGQHLKVHKINAPLFQKMKPTMSEKYNRCLDEIGNFFVSMKFSQTDQSLETKSMEEISEFYDSWISKKHCVSTSLSTAQILIKVGSIM